MAQPSLYLRKPKVWGPTEKLSCSFPDALVCAVLGIGAHREAPGGLSLPSSDLVFYQSKPYLQGF